MFAVFFSLASGCSKKQSDKDKKDEFTAADTVTVEDTIIDTSYSSDNTIINLFTLYSIDSTNSVFVSLSDIYPLSEHPDSVAVPEVQKPDLYADRYIKLESKYRKQFLSGTGVFETDSVFVFDYAYNNLTSFSVKELNIIAVINAYADMSDWPFSVYDYMIGFEIDKRKLKGYENLYYNTFVYVGKENPFARERLTPVVWSKIKPENYPLKKTRNKYAEYFTNLTVGNTYLFEKDSFKYFLQDYVNSYDQVSIRRLLVAESGSEDIIIDKIFGLGEGTTPSLLNYENDNEGINQWTGKLFKNKPPVIFGFEYISFGCPFLSVIDKLNEDIYINCDNRH